MPRFLNAIITGGELRKIFGRRKLESKIRGLRGHYIVCGYDRIGRPIWEDLARESVPCVVVDSSSERTAELEINELQLSESSPYVGKTLRNSRIREQSGVMVVAIKRATGPTVYSPTADAMLNVGDTLITIGRRGAMASSKLV